MKKIISNTLILTSLVIASYGITNAQTIQGSVDTNSNSKNIYYNNNNDNDNNNNWNHNGGGWNNWGNETAPNNCKSWYDGCNTCTRQYPGGPLVCTKLACFAHGQPYCKDYFGNNNNWNGNGWGGGWNGWGNQWNGWGWNSWNNNNWNNWWWRR